MTVAVKKTKTQLLEEVYENPMPLTGPVKINIDILEKIWDYRFVIFKLKNFDFKKMKADVNYEPTYEYRLVRYLRRGSAACSKVTISNDVAGEIIERLNLVFQTQGWPDDSKSGGTYRKEGFSEFDLMKKPKAKKV